ncbi:MAG: hypothetical protein NTW86_09035, partial [Candidatus Sumerlaeota bacterium]|nr:hypothetical protein [Candidatus Sumerlaeota bacterium]
MRKTTGVFLCVLAACVVVTSGHLHAPDDEVLFRLAQSIARHGSLAVEPITQGFGTMKGRDGREYAQYGVGQALLAAPLVWAGDGLAQLLGPRARRLVLAPDTARLTGGDPREISERFCVSFFNAFVTAALAAMLFSLCLRIKGDSGAAWATAL